MSQAIRIATPADAAQVQAIYAPYVETPISFEQEPPGVEEMGRRIARLQDRYPWLVCEVEQAVVGYAYASPHRERAAYQWSVEVSVYVRVNQQRRGIGRTLYSSLFEILALQGYCNAYAGVTLPNPAGVGLHTSLGFQPVGVYSRVGYKCGAWHDVAWFSLDLDRRPDPPAPPRSVAAVLNPGSHDRTPREVNPSGPEAMTIRVYRDPDREAVIALWRSVFAYTTPHNEPALSIRRKMDAQPELFFVAEMDGLIAGTVMGGYDGHRGWIYSLAVAPELRGGGIGTALVRRAEEALARMGCPKVNLQVFQSNAGAVAFYEKLGYRVEERVSMGKIL